MYLFNFWHTYKLRVGVKRTQAFQCRVINKLLDLITVQQNYLYSETVILHLLMKFM